MDLRTLQNALARLAQERAADPLQSPKNVAFALGADAGLVLSLFRGLSEHQGLDDPVAREAAADALTSILVHAAQLSNHVGLDASAALRARIKGKPAPALAAPGAPAVTLPPSAAKAPEPTAPVATAPVAAAPASAIRKRATEVISVKVAAPAVALQPPAAGAVEVIVVDEEGGPPPEDDALPPQPAAPVPVALAASAPAALPDGPVSLPPAAVEHIHAEEVLELANALARQLDRSTRHDPVLRDLRDELDTLRRSLYAANTKQAWIAGSLRSLRAHLEEALSHSFAEEVRAAEFIGRIERLLAQP